MLKPNGFFGFIIPNNWLTIETFSDFRKFILKNTAELHIIDLHEKVFGEASVDTCILIFKKAKPTRIQVGEMREGDFRLIGNFEIKNFEDKIINVSSLQDNQVQKLLSKIESKSMELGNLAQSR